MTLILAGNRSNQHTQLASGTETTEHQSAHMHNNDTVISYHTIVTNKPFAFSALTLLVGRQEGHLDSKN